MCGVCRDAWVTVVCVYVCVCGMCGVCRDAWVTGVCRDTVGDRCVYVWCV